MFVRRARVLFIPTIKKSKHADINRKLTLGKAKCHFIIFQLFFPFQQTTKAKNSIDKPKFSLQLLVTKKREIAKMKHKK